MGRGENSLLGDPESELRLSIEGDGVCEDNRRDENGIKYRHHPPVLDTITKLSK